MACPLLLAAKHIGAKAEARLGDESATLFKLRHWLRERLGFPRQAQRFQARSFLVYGASFGRVLVIDLLTLMRALCILPKIGLTINLEKGSAPGSYEPSSYSTRYYFTSASYTNKVELSSSGMKYARRPEAPASTQTGFCDIGSPDGDHSSIGT